MALPNTNISTTLVGQTLGSGSRDVGTLCTHPNINKWSRWKPVRANKVDGITLSDIASVRGGLQFIEFDTPVELLSFYRNNLSYSFDYLSPRGGNNNPSEPYRLGDFRNYDHEAFRWYILGGKREMYFTSDPVAQLFLQTEGVNPDYNLNWASVSMLDHYYGAMFVRAGASTVYMDLSDTPFSNTSVSAYIADVPILGLTDGTYEVYSFIYRNEPGSPPQVKYIPIDGGYMGTATLRASRLELDGGGTIQTDTPIYYRVDWNIEFENLDTSSVIINNVEVAARYINSAPWSPLNTGEVSENLGNIQVNSLQTVLRSGTFRNCLQNLAANGGTAYLQVNNSSDASLRRTFVLTGP